MEELQNLSSVLIGLRKGQAILPQSVVVESLPYATPLRIENAPPWVVGAILWRARTTPLVSLETLIEGSRTDPGARSRIVVLNALGNDPKLPNYCILGTEMPQSISLRRSEIVIDEEEILRPEGVLAHVRINNEEGIIIPNLDFIEEVLSQVMRRKSLTHYDFRRSESSL